MDYALCSQAATRHSLMLNGASEEDVELCGISEMMEKKEHIEEGFPEEEEDYEGGKKRQKR